MTNLTLHRETVSLPLVRPEPREGPMTVRYALSVDGGFVDALQKKHSKMVGFLPLKAIEKRIANKQVVIAEQRGLEACGLSPEASDGSAFPKPHVSSLKPVPIGYCIFEDCYMKHEDVGICYQLNVVPHKQRGLVGAALIQGVFERCAYGTKLFCCWCAQDIAANHFWESIGFVPLAYRAGSRGQAQGGTRKEQRIHIFWQKRVREGDTTTPWWYPSQTKGGALKEDRLVLPIQPGTHWSEVKLVVLPGAEQLSAAPHSDQQSAEKKRRAKSKSKAVVTPPKNAMAEGGGLWFAPPAPPTPPPPTPEEIEAAKARREKRPRQPPRKNDPKLVAAAREFRDRYLEQVNAEGGEGGRLLASNGKYNVSRQLEAGRGSGEGSEGSGGSGGRDGGIVMESVPLLNAA